MSETIRKNWAAIVLAIVTTGLGGQLLGLWNLSVEREDSYVTKYVECQREIVDINAQLAKVTNRLSTLEFATIDLPFPFWVKDLRGDIIHISETYERQILSPLNLTRIDLLGTKGELIGEDFVTMVLANDARVIKEGHVIKLPESIPGLDDGVSYKYPITNNFGKVSGTAGIWIPVSVDK